MGEKTPSGSNIAENCAPRQAEIWLLSPNNTNAQVCKIGSADARNSQFETQNHTLT
jgi:hypothetical protein